MQSIFNRFVRSAAAISLLTICSLSANAGLLLDGGFEEPNGNSPWAFTTGAGLSSNSPISGSQSAFLSNASVAVGSFAVGFQNISLAQSDLAVGDEIFLSALASALSTQGPFDRVYIELALRTSDAPEIPGQVGDVDFANSVSADVVFNSNTVQSLVTDSLVISDLITPNNGIEGSVRAIRVAIALFNSGNNSLTEVNIDDIQLTKVSSPSVLALMVITLAFFASRKHR